jgi:hypothetical protein
MFALTLIFALTFQTSAAFQTFLVSRKSRKGARTNREKEMTHTRSLKGTKFFVKQNKLINGKCFQPFERIELIEPFEHLKHLKLLKPQKPPKPLKPLQPFQYLSIT